ncbi:hypothetical protein AAY473_019116 [Plecturocebus cupreus]
MDFKKRDTGLREGLSKLDSESRSSRFRSYYLAAAVRGASDLIHFTLKVSLCHRGWRAVAQVRLTTISPSRTQIQSRSVSQAGMRWHNLGSLQPLPPRFQQLSHLNHQTMSKQNKPAQVRLANIATPKMDDKWAETQSDTGIYYTLGRAHLCAKHSKRGYRECMTTRKECVI